MIPKFSEYLKQSHPTVVYPAKDLSYPYATMVLGNPDFYPEGLVQGDIHSTTSDTYKSNSVIMYPVFDMPLQDILEYWAGCLSEYHPYDYTNMIYLLDPDWYFDYKFSSFAPSFSPSRAQKQHFLDVINTDKLPISGFVDVVVPSKSIEGDYTVVRVKSPSQKIGYKDAYDTIRNKLLGH